MSQILFVGDSSTWSERAVESLRAAFDDVDVVTWDHGAGAKPDIPVRPREWIFSFKSDLLLPHRVIASASRGAVNFHPAPPEYRGIGGYHYAIANGDDSFGATCHLMDDLIDHGAILQVTRFAIGPTDTPATLREKSAQASLQLLERFLERVVAGGGQLSSCGATWGPTLYTRAMLQRWLAQGAAGAPALLSTAGK